MGSWVIKRGLTNNAQLTADQQLLITLVEGGKRPMLYMNYAEKLTKI